MSRLLIGETQKDLAAAMKDHFARDGFNVHLEANGLRILQCLRDNQYDVIVLEIALAGLDGIGVVLDYRAAGGSTPILLLASRHCSEELQRGLDAGADSYLVKPFQLSDLSAQLRALLRRPSFRTERILVSGVIALDTRSGTVTKSGAPLKLHPMEFRLLHFLLSHANQVFNANVLFERVWQKDDGANDGTVRTHIRSLRRKIDMPGEPSTITTVRGLGYKAT